MTVLTKLTWGSVTIVIPIPWKCSPSHESEYLWIFTFTNCLIDGCVYWHSNIQCPYKRMDKASIQAELDLEVLLQINRLQNSGGRNGVIVPLNAPPARGTPCNRLFFNLSRLSQSVWELTRRLKRRRNTFRIVLGLMFFVFCYPGHRILYTVCTYIHIHNICVFLS